MRVIARVFCATFLRAASRFTGGGLFHSPLALMGTSSVCGQVPHHLRHIFQLVAPHSRHLNLLSLVFVARAIQLFVSNRLVIQRL